MMCKTMPLFNSREFDLAVCTVCWEIHNLFFSNLNQIIYVGFAIPYFYNWGRKLVFLWLKLDPSLTIYSITGSRVSRAKMLID